MKTLIYIFSILLMTSCACNDCEETANGFYEYSIVNNSGKTVEIVPFYKNATGIEEINSNYRKIIENGKTLTEKHAYGNGNSQYNYTIMLQAGTKVEIVFDNAKKITYDVSCLANLCNDTKNIFHISHNNDKREIYYISADDYNNATVCNGNCY